MHSGENGDWKSEDSQVGDDADGRRAQKLGQKRDAFCADMGAKRRMNRSALKDIQKGEGDTCKVYNNE